MANKIWYIEDQDINQYPGTYAEYEEWNTVRQKQISLGTLNEVKKEKPVKEKTKPQPTDEINKQIKKLNLLLQDLENQVSDKEKLVKSIENEMADENLYSDTVKLKEANIRYALAKESLGALQLHWEEVALEVESLTQTMA